MHGLISTGAGGRFLLGAMTALCGMPPFGLFISELLLVAAGVASRQWIPLGFGLLGIALGFIALSRAAIEIEGGRAKAAPQRPAASRLSAIAAGVALAGALLTIVVPWTPLGSVLHATSSRIEGAP